MVEQPSRRSFLRYSGTAVTGTALLGVAGQAAASDDWKVKISETTGNETYWEFHDKYDNWHGYLNDDETTLGFNGDVTYMRAKGDGKITFSTDCEEAGSDHDIQMDVTQYDGQGEYYVQTTTDIGDCYQGNPDNTGTTYVDSSISSDTDHKWHYQVGRCISGILEPKGSDLWVYREHP